jgi:hypothetical protein
MGEDPFAVLGVGPDSALEELRAARNRLAKQLHPDHAGGDAAAMQRINAAFDAAVATRLRPRPGPSPDAGVRVARSPDRIVHDVASFTI